MGSISTQIACGKRYTLVLIPSGGRIYGFGQLSNKGSIKSSSPQVIKGPWTSSEISKLSSSEKQDNDDSMSEKVMVKKIFVGDEQCCVAVVEEFKKETPADFRDYSADSQIAYLTVALAKHCSDVEKNATLDFVSITYVYSKYSKL